MDEIFIQIRFSKETEFGEFNEALYYSLDDYASLNQKDIEIAKQERVDGWIENLRNPPPVPEATKEDILTQLDVLEAEKAELHVQLLEDFEVTKEELQKIVENLDIQKEIIQEKITEIENADPIKSDLEISEASEIKDIDNPTIEKK